MNGIGLSIVSNFVFVNQVFKKFDVATELLRIFCFLRLYQQKRVAKMITTSGETITIFSRVNTYPQVPECLNLSSITMLSACA